VALAEHFGGRIAPAGGDAPDAGDPYDRFVAVMNEEARRLGLTATHYDNPHGLTTHTHKSSARDLLTLTRAAMELALFREIVNTPQYECVVEGPGGYRRRIVWRNTNRLLGIEGYLGVKTGTTTAAGACLVSHGVRDDRPLFVAVLGSASNDSRYADTRNLFRWAWSQLRQTSAADR
jgi:D-alanyl-D-alanine carboxypeptidase (penicillin-binding protein 5/6)